MYEVRRVHIGRTQALDEVAHACGELYSKTLVFFWRTVRHKGIWLKPKHLMRLFTSEKLHKVKHQIRDIEHKSTTRLVSTLYAEGVQTLVIGDVRDIRQDNDVGSTNNQKLHQWSHGHVRHLLTYKAQRRGMAVALQDEHYTSRTCPVCEHIRKSKVAGRVFHCTNTCCGFSWHRDGVGAINIRQKYLGCGPVVGAMAPPIGMRFRPHAYVAHSEKG